MNESKFDVAISFLHQDLAIARELADALAPRLRVFIYERQQEDVAGTDGMETFRHVFRSESLLNVVLLREHYGSTRWTRVELTAIQEKALEDGWQTVLVVSVEAAVKPPKWLPSSRILGSLPEYGMNGLAAVVLARAREIGAPDRQETVAELGVRLARQAADAERRRRLSNSYDGVSAAVLEAQRMFALASDALGAAATLQDSGVRFRVAQNPDQVLAIVDRFSLSAYWDGQVVNVLEGAGVTVIHFRGLLQLPGDASSPGRRPEEANSYRMLPELHPGDTWNWRLERGKSVLSTEAAADHIARSFLRFALGAAGA